MKRFLIEMLYFTVIIGNTVNPNFKNRLKYQTRIFCIWVRLGCLDLYHVVSNVEMILKYLLVRNETEREVRPDFRIETF